MRFDSSFNLPLLVHVAELMTLYETMFSQWDIPTSQLLVTAFDFTSPERYHVHLLQYLEISMVSSLCVSYYYTRRESSFTLTSSCDIRCNNIQHVISQLLALGIVPILNENDAVFDALPSVLTLY